MRGQIYADRCICGGSMVHNERKHNCFCERCGRPATTRYIVRFNQTTKRFTNYQQAAQFLNGLRFEMAKGTYDPRDYRADFPLGFRAQSEKWLDVKRLQVKASSWRNLRNYIQKAVAAWGDTNCKEINYGHIERFLLVEGGFQNDKTRHNARSALKSFFAWLRKTERIPEPEFPDIRYELGYRNLTDLDTQERIIEEIRRIATNPKLPLAIELLATYPALRPDDLRRVNEGDYRDGYLTIQHPTKRRNQVKVVRLLSVHYDQWEAFVSRFPAVPSLPFFRHHGDVQGVAVNEPFGPNLLSNWWRRACKNLGITGLDLYGGTRHTTTTAMAQVVGTDKTKKTTMHETNKAFARYCQTQDDTAWEVVKAMDAKKRGKVIKLKKERF